MSTLTKKQRDALPESAFGDPARRLFPIVDCSDVADAAHLIGKAKNPGAVKARIISLAKAKNCTIPDAWKEDAKMSVTFAMDTSGRYRDGDWWVYPNSLLFEAGVYEDKDFSLTPEEMWLAVDRFEPVFGNIEHTKFLKGKACHVRDIRFDDADSTILRGSVAVPHKLDDLLEDHERRLSCEWNKSTKMLTGIGLVVDPRVPEAALMSIEPEVEVTFAAVRHSTPHGQAAVQRIHNVAAEAGAVCAKGNANMASRHEATAVQAAHDLMVEHGATCASLSPGNAFPAFGAGLASTTPTAAALAATSPTKEAKHMTPVETFMAWLQGNPSPSTAETPAQAAPVVQSLAPVASMSAADAEFKAMKQRADAAEAESRRLRQERIAEKAVAFADKQLTEERAFPTEREAIIAAYEGAAIDDVNFGVVTFGDGQTTTRTARLEAAYASRPAHQLTVESLTPAIMSVLQGHRETPMQDAHRKATPEELDELLGMTVRGQALMAQPRGTDHNGHTNGRA